MPESKVRKSAVQKKVAKRNRQATETHQSKAGMLARMSGSRDWVPYVFIPVALLGVSWLVVYYIAGMNIPLMSTLGNWNFGIGMGLIAISFMIATLWK